MNEVERALAIVRDLAVADELKAYKERRAAKMANARAGKK